MRNKVGIIKRISALVLIFLLSINSFAAIVSDNDGSAFVTKAEFNALKSNFESQIRNYNDSIDRKIDGAIAAYLSGMQLINDEEIKNVFSVAGNTLKGYPIIWIVGKNNTKWFDTGWATGTYFGDWNLMPSVEYNVKGTWWWGLNNDNNTYWHPDISVISCDLQISDKDSLNQSISYNGSGNRVDHFEYGLRCIIGNEYYARFYPSYTNWTAGFVAFDETNPWKITLYSSMNEQAGSYSLTGNIINFSRPGYGYSLRDGGTYAGRPDVTLPYNIQASDFSTMKNTYTLVKPTDGTSSFNGTASSVNIVGSYAGTSSLTYGDATKYFFPNADDNNNLYFNDTSNVANNWEAVTLPDEGVKWDELDSYFHIYSKNLSRHTSELSKVIADLPECGYGSSNLDSPPPTIINGSFRRFKVSNKKNVRDVVYADLTDSFGIDCKVGDTPLFIEKTSKKGEVTTQGGIAFSYWTAQWDGSGKHVKVSFTNNGRADEYNAGTDAVQDWQVNNKKTFEWKTTTESTWHTATECDFELNGNIYYDFRFNVERNEEVYLHVICPTEYNEQNVLVKTKAGFKSFIRYED